VKLDRALFAVAALGLVGAALWFGNSSSSHSEAVPEADRSRACTSVTGTAEERLSACLSELSPVKLTRAAKEEAEDFADEKGSKILVAGDRLDLKGEQIALEGDAALQKLLLATDEAAAAKQLREQGVRGVIVHRDITQAVDRDSSVISRLAHHDFLDWFQLRWVTEELMLYTVRGTPMRITENTGEMLLSGLRARLAREPAPRQTWKPDNVRLIGTVRLQGQALVMRHSQGDDVEGVLSDLAEKIRRRWEREVEPDGLGRLEERLDEARIEVHVVMERARVEPRTRWQLFDLWEMGIDGAILNEEVVGEDEARFGFMPGSEATAHAFKSADSFLQHTATEHGWRDRRPWERSEVELSVIRDQHFMEARPGGGEGVRMVRGMPEVSMDELTDENLRQMLVDGGEWWLRNQRADGSFVYKYWPEQNRYSTEYNEVRHILATRDLSDTWRYRQDPRYLDGARKAMDWLLAYEVKDTDAADPVLPNPPAGTSLFRYPKGAKGNQKLGTTAVALLGWIEWAKATGSHEEDERIRRMAKYVLSQREPNGRFIPYNVPSGHPYRGQVNDIVPGEAALALGMVAEYFDEKEWLEFFPGFLDYYEPWFRTRAAEKQSAGRWPHTTYTNEKRLELVQFGPWSVMASKQYYKMTGDERAAKFGLEVADWMIDNYQWTEGRTPWPDYVGGYYKLPEELPAMQTFCYSEGTAAAYTIAAKFSPDTKDKYDRSTREALRFLRVMQYDEVDSYFAPRPEVVHGGIKYAMNENKIRIDYVGHGLSTVSQYLDARAADPAVKFELKPLAANEGWTFGQGAQPLPVEGELEIETADPSDEGGE
jgi:hypothetical protein